MKKPKPEKRLEWIFFGLNQVVINPDKLSFNIYQQLQRYLHIHGLKLTFSEILATREDLVLGHEDEAPYLTIARMYLSKSDYQNWHHQVHDFHRDRMQKDLIIIPGMDDAIRQLSQQYSLGIIADQPAETLHFLKRKRLLQFFGIHAVSGSVNISKPRKKLFEWAVNHAGCSFERCLMVGYRLNEDIVPAKQLDMMTVQARWDIDRKGYHPKANKQALYLNSLHRIDVWSLDSENQKDKPDATVTSPEKLFRTIQMLDRQA